MEKNETQAATESDPVDEVRVEGVGRDDLANHQAPAVEGSQNAFEARHRLGMTLLEGEAQGLRRIAKLRDVAIQSAGGSLVGVASLGSGIGDFIEPIGNAARDRRCRPQLRPRGIRNLDLAEVAGLVGQRPPQRDELLGELTAPRPGIGLQCLASAGGEEGVALEVGGAGMVRPDFLAAPA